MRNNKKKGFTLVELLVVIAIIAVLATVSIIGYTVFIDAANKSADEQAVNQINSYLESYEVGKNKEDLTFDAIKAALEEGDLDVNDYVPLTKDTYFYWVKDWNRVVQADKSSSIIYPEDYEGDALPAGAYSLSGVTPKDNNWTVTTGTANINSGEKFFDFVESYVDGSNKTNDVAVVEIAGNIDLKGAVASFDNITKPLSIKGTGETPATITGLRDDSESNVAVFKNPDNTVVDRPYNFGMIGKIASGQTVTIENVVIDGSNVTFNTDAINDEPSRFGLIAGLVDKDATLILKNVTIKNSNVTGYQKVGALVGQLWGTLVCENVKIENTTVTGYAQTAALVGAMDTNANISIDENCKFDVDVKSLDPFAIDSGFDARGTKVTATDGTTYVWELDKADASNAYGYVTGITNEYYWTNVTNAEVVNEYWNTGLKTSDGKTIWSSEIRVPSSAKTITNGVAAD